MSLDESVQTSVMLSVNDLSQRVPESRSHSHRNQEDSHVLNNEAGTSGELDNVREECAELRRRCFSLDQQVAALQEEKQTLCLDNEKLVERMGHMGDNVDVRTAAHDKIQQLTKLLQRHQDDLYRLEAEKEDFKNQNDNLQSELAELKLRVEELAPMETRYRQLKDEADELRNRAAEAKKIEATLENYRNKIKEHSDLKVELKVLQDKNANYMKSVIELEEEQRKNGTLKTQVEAYKRSIQDLETRMATETRRADKAEYEGKRVMERLEGVNQERDQLRMDRDQWKDAAAELKLTLSANYMTNDSSGDESKVSRIGGILASAGSPSELKERLVRLEAENEMLRQNGGRDEELRSVQEDLETVKARKAELDTELRLANQKVMELEGKAQDLEQQQLQGQQGHDARLAARHEQVEQLRLQLDQVTGQLQDARNVLEKKESSMSETDSRVQTLQSELGAAQAKLKTYMEKARTVIVSLEQQSKMVDGQGTELSRHEFDSLRREIEVKDRRIGKLQDELDKSAVMQEQEQRLVTTAFYGMAMQTHKNAVERKTMGDKSFLSKQRHVVTARPSATTQPALRGTGKNSDGRMNRNDWTRRRNGDRRQ